MHVHYLLDADPSPFIGTMTPIPMGNPNIVHTASMSQTFSGVAAGPHRVTVVLGLSNHVAVQPAVAPAVNFTVGAAGAQQVPVPAQLPRTGDADTGVTWLALVGVLGLTVGTLLRRRSAHAR
jgi:LPXTG-motif cell wall-anchored protein